MGQSAENKIYDLAVLRFGCLYIDVEITRAVLLRCSVWRGSGIRYAFQELERAAAMAAGSCNVTRKPKRTRVGQYPWYRPEALFTG
jgi:hypothetical protein